MEKNKHLNNSKEHTECGGLKTELSSRVVGVFRKETGTIGEKS